MNNRTIISFVLYFVTTFIVWSATSWIGGDQSATSGSTFHVDNNWSTGVAPTNKTSDTIVIDQDGANVRWISSTSGFYLFGAMTIGGANSQYVTVDFQSNRTTPPSNENTSNILLYDTLSIIGSNTTVRISTGLNLELRAESEPFVLDPAATFCGDGVVSFSGTLVEFSDYDFDNLWLVFGKGGEMPVYVLSGGINTKGDIKVSSTGSGGVNNISTLNLNGKTVKCNNCILGIEDIRPESGDQSGFGSIDFSGSILEVTGDIVFLSNPDGLKTDGTPLTEDSSLTDSSVDNAGGTLILSGSFTNITSKTPEKWNIQNLDFIFNGDGSAIQSIEVMSSDLGDTSTSSIDNYCWGELTVKTGASVKLVDFNENSDRASGAESLYCSGLVVESGAKLDLNGLNVYVAGDIVIEGTVVENGGSINTLSAGPFRLYTYSLGSTDNSAGLGMWTGPMAVGDINNDGINELFVSTIDEESADDDCRLFALNYDRGVVTNLSGYPVSDSILASGVDLYFLNFIVDDLGNGFGPELHYSNKRHSRIYAIGESATPHMVSKNENASYGFAAQIFCDIDHDDSKELICAGRGSSGNVRVYDTDTQMLKWSKYIDADAYIATQVGIGDLDLDGSKEICAIAKSSTGTYGVTAFRSDGSIYMGTDGNTPISNMPFASSINETYGGLSIANVDEDIYPEFIYAGYMTGSELDVLTVMKQDGIIKFNVDLTHGNANGFALLDVDTDGEYEILYADTLYDGDGSVLQTLPTPSESSYFSFFTMPVLADFNGDQIPEAVYLCSSISYKASRVVCVYDFMSQSMLSGFPIDIKAVISDSESESIWYAGQFHHFGGMTPLVADLDNDGDWEIIIGTGIGVSTTLENPTLNIIDTPYQYLVPEGHNVENYGWYSYRHGPLADFKFPLLVQTGTLIIIQ